MRLVTILRYAQLLPRMLRMRPDSPRTVADVIEEQAAARGSHPFVRFEDRAVSYAEHNAACNRIAHWARGAGLGTGDVVALLMENRPEYLQVWGGLAKLGVTSALINTNLTGRSLGHALVAANTRRIVVGVECLEALGTLEDAPEDLEVWVLREVGRKGEVPRGARDLDLALAGASVVDPPRSARAGARCADDLFYIYTSGTTGLPKAARFSHLKFFTTGGVAHLAGFDRRGTMYCALPLYHSAGGAMCVSAALQAGGTLALRKRFSASQFWDDVRRFDATAFQYIGEFCRYLLNQKPDPRDGDHRLEFCVGNGLRPDIWESFRDRFKIPNIVEFYGATEGNIAMVNLDNKVGSVGKKPPALVADGRLIRYDVDADDHPRDAKGRCIECKPGEVGELIGRLPRRAGDSRGRFEGYTSKEATEKKILRNVLEGNDAWFRTGDLLRADAQGYFYFVDRIGDTFRWKGENVSTQEVAEACAGFPGVEMANAFGIAVPGGDGRAGMVALVLVDPRAFDGAAFYAFVSERLPAYAAPVFVRLQGEADVTGTFKLRKVDLAKEGYDPAVVKDPLWLRDDAARAYVELTPERYAAVQAGKVRL
jgi:fatty-acyl-CoA synthase